MPALLVMLLAPRARADDAPSSVSFDLGATTYFPLDIGAEATVELPYRILVRADAGWMPTAYSNTIVDLLGDFGALSPAEQSLVKGAIQNSFVARFSAGWRPFSKLGLELLVGYTLLTAGGSVTGTDVLDSFLSSSGSSDRFTGVTNASVPLRATLHNLDGTVDWRFQLWDDRLVLRASLGYIQCVASSLTVSGTASRPADQAVASRLNAELAGELNPYFTEYVKAPLVGLTLAYRF